MKRGNWFLNGSLLGGLAFLYLPIASLVFYSFNESKLVTVCAGFSTKWYGALLENKQILDAAYLSLKIGAINACHATLLGTLRDDLDRSDKTVGLATLCIASGMGAATIIERV